MKSTGEIPDNLLEEVERLAARAGTTVKALIEQGSGPTASLNRAEKRAAVNVAPENDCKPLPPDEE